MDITIESPAARQVQSTNFYCGAACAAMMLAFLGRKVTQDAAYEIIRTGNLEPASFYTDPQGLVQCLKSSLTNVVTTTDFSNEATSDASATLSAALDHLSTARTPVPVLVKGGAHWILIDGMVVDDTDGIKTVKMVWCVDPWPQAVDRTLIPSDVFCTDYLAPIHYGDHWRNQRVLIQRIGVKPDPGVKFATQPEIGGGGEPDDGVIVANLARLGVDNIGSLLAGGVDFEPITVTDLEGGPDYVIRPLDGIKNVAFGDVIMVAHDANTGRILEVTRFGSRLTYFSDAEAAALASAQTHDTVKVAPGWFFFASRQLRSRFMVARRLDVGNVTQWLMPDGTLRLDRDPVQIGGQ